MIIGANYADIIFNNSSKESGGIVYFYKYDDVSLQYLLQTTFAGKTNFDYFGGSVSIYGSYAISSSSYSNSLGTVHLYENINDNWQLNSFSNNDVKLGDSFGYVINIDCS